MPIPITHCRICGNPNLVQVLDLGEQVLSGVFPTRPDQAVTSGPLRLVKCGSDSNIDVCGLVQLAHSYNLNEMYGDNYGYRSGLNPSMVNHLQGKVQHILAMGHLSPGDLVVDIGSNDSTTLQAYPADHYRLVGIDPTGDKFRRYYPQHVELIPDFFSLDTFRTRFGEQKAKVVTSFSMFYDLETPLAFMAEVRDVLHDDGVWVFEQSYMPTMLERNAYDTVCHEHLEYYGMKQIKWMTDRSGLKIVDVEFNDINGGSFSVTVAKAESSLPAADAAIAAILVKEKELGLDTMRPYAEFAARVAASRHELLKFLQQAKRRGQQVYALGASTKGNVLLQYCGLSQETVHAVGEVNPEKFGRLTPGTLLPIIAEDQALSEHPDYLIVLPWHFRRFMENNPKFRGRRLVFPLPHLEVVEVA